MKNQSTSMQVQSYNNTEGGERYSAAEDCKKILEQEGSEGVKSEGKRTKRELNRGISERHWHVRPADEKLRTLKCVTIQIPNPNLSFCDICIIIIPVQRWVLELLL